MGAVTAAAVPARMRQRFRVVSAMTRHLSGKRHVEARGLPVVFRLLGVVQPVGDVLLTVEIVVAIAGCRVAADRPAERGLLVGVILLGVVRSIGSS